MCGSYLLEGDTGSGLLLPPGTLELSAILGGDGGAEEERGLAMAMLLGRFFRIEAGIGGTGGMEEERREERRGWEGGWEEEGTEGTEGTEIFVLRWANALRLSCEGAGNWSRDCALLSATLVEGKPTLGLVDLAGTGTGTAVTVTSERGDASGLHMSGSSKCTRWERVLRRERDEFAEEDGVSGRPVRPRGPSESVSIRTSSQ